MDTAIPILTAALPACIILGILGFFGGFIAWALLSGGKKEKRRKAFLTDLGLTIVSENPPRVTGTYRGHELILDGVSVRLPKGRTELKTQIFISSAGAYTTAVHRTNRGPADTQPAGGDMRRVVTGDDAFDSRFEVYVKSEADEACWQDPPRRAALLGIGDERKYRVAGCGGAILVTTSPQQVAITLNCGALISNVTDEELQAAMDLAVSLTA